MIPSLTAKMLSQARVIAKGNRIRDVQRLVDTYGGRKSQWVKKSSPHFSCRTQIKASELNMIVKLRRKNFRHPDLTPQQNYVVIGIEADALRLLNDQGRPYLYPAHLFEVVDSQEPADWVTEYGEENEGYAYPSPLNEVGFFEDFFDEKKKVVAAFWHVVNQRLAVARDLVQASRTRSLPKTRFNPQARSAQRPTA
jgi:hypothetical protein